jgi:hypothetical protein
MPIEQLTYHEIGQRLGVTPEAARALTKRYRLPRLRGNDGKTLVAIDLNELRHKPLDRAVTTWTIAERGDRFAQGQDRRA